MPDSSVKNVKKILIVCTGNSCRSIMAEGCLSKELSDAGINDTIVISAGTSTIGGLMPTAETIQVVKEHGIDVSGYVSSNLSRMHVEKADIILVMAEIHRDAILRIMPSAKNKIRFLREFSSETDRNEKSIADPIGMPIGFYREIFEIIKDSVEGFVKWLKKSQ